MEILLAPALPTTEALAAIKRVTTAEFRALDFEDKSFVYELLNGELLKRFCDCRCGIRRRKRLATERIFIAAGRQNLTQGDYVQGASDLVMEVVSVGTMKCDRGDKLKSVFAFASSRKINVVQ